MTVVVETSFWQVQDLPLNPQIASNPSPFDLQTRQIRAERGICASLGIKNPAREVHSGCGSGHPAARWFRFYENLHARKALAFEDLEIKIADVY
jgi:hypothetical protein